MDKLEALKKEFPDADGAECLSRIDGSIEHVSGYHLILEDY